MDKVFAYGSTAMVESREDNVFDADFIISPDLGIETAFGIIGCESEKESIEDPDYGTVVAKYNSWGCGSTCWFRTD